MGIKVHSLGLLTFSLTTGNPYGLRVFLEGAELVCGCLWKASWEYLKVRRRLGRRMREGMLE